MAQARPIRLVAARREMRYRNGVLRILCYLWAAPATLLGLLAAAIACLTGGSARVVQGALEVRGGFATWFLRHGVPFVESGAAMTLGHVILGQNVQCLESSRKHEHVHVRQYERWGPFFLPLYISASLILWMRGRDPYLDNPFEREAYEQAP
jgi:hypothetical protein